jgi:serine/threonine protein kinase
MAPELLKKDEFGRYSDMFDEKSDIWSLGGFSFFSFFFFISLSTSGAKNVADDSIAKVLLYALAFNKLPFIAANAENYDSDAVVAEITNFKKVIFPERSYRNPQLLNMIERLLRVDPRERPSTIEILSDSVIIAKVSKQRKGKKKNHLLLLNFLFFVIRITQDNESLSIGKIVGLCEQFSANHSHSIV